LFRRRSQRRSDRRAGAWRTNGSLLARNTLIVAHAHGDTSRQTGALDELRRAATPSRWTSPPAGSGLSARSGRLGEAARRIQPGSWTHTAAPARTSPCGSTPEVFLDEATPTDTARYCLDVLTDDSAFVSRTTPTPSFLVVPYTLDALSGVLDAADDALHRDLARFIAGLPPVVDQLEARGRAQVAGGLRATVLSSAEDRATWRQAAVSQPDRRLAAAILGLLTDRDEQARELLLAWIADGDNDALAALGPGAPNWTRRSLSA